MDTTTPRDYPNAPVSGIHDAQAFSIGNSDTVHAPARYPSTNMVVARCGQYGYVIETDTRSASWRDAFPTCARCTRR